MWLVHAIVRLCDLRTRSPNKRQSPVYGGRSSNICLGPPPWSGNSSNHPAGTEERLLRLVGSFPEARPVLGEAAEDLCVGGRHSGSGVRRQWFPPDGCRRFNVWGVTIIRTASTQNVIFYHHMYTCCHKFSQHLYITSYFVTTSLHSVIFCTTCVLVVINYHNIST